MTEQLKALAEAATPGPWTYFPKPKYNEHHVSIPIDGSGMRRALFDDGCQTDRPEADAKFIAAANPERILALIAENERLQRIADDFQNRWNSERQINESQISGGRYPDGTPAW